MLQFETSELCPQHSELNLLASFTVKIGPESVTFIRQIDIGIFFIYLSFRKEKQLYNEVGLSMQK